MVNKLIRYFLENKLVTALLMFGLIGWGIISSPFDWGISDEFRNPVPVDAIPDIGENQQIVFTKWMGRSPQDIEDQITYPLTTSLLGIPGVKTIRSNSIFGFSSIYIVFEEDVEFYWSRSRILEKLSSLPANLIPDEVKPTLGPDATALGQIFWYTLEGRDPEGNPTGGWDLHELRTLQDFYVKYGLSATSGVSEVASIGGFVQEYQVDLNPEAMQSLGVSLQHVVKAVKESNRDVGAKTIEINQAEYLVRGLGYVNSIEDLEKAVVKVNQNVPIRIKDVAHVTLGPSSRRGILDKDGAEVVGGAVVARFGSNPLEVINGVKKKIAEISTGLPKRVLEDGTVSQVTIVPFYDRSKLIEETLGTLEEALALEILICIFVVLIMVFNLRASLIISSLLPLSILIVFIAMKHFGVDANIVALSGIAIAIGTMVDLGIILSENIIKSLDKAIPGQSALESVYQGAAEVSGAIVTAVSTTIVSFIPVFTLQAAEGKLFTPLAFTKTFALLAALIISLVVLPSLAHILFGVKVKRPQKSLWFNILLAVFGVAFLAFGYFWAGFTVIAISLVRWQEERLARLKWLSVEPILLVSIISVLWLLSVNWVPLGAQKSDFVNFLFVLLLLAIIVAFFKGIEKFYRRILTRCLNHKKTFLVIPTVIFLFAMIIWMGFHSIFGFVSDGADKLGWNLRSTAAYSAMDHAFPGIGQEFMPALDEGSFLLMPTSMAHSGIEFNKKTLQQLDMLLANIPEVELAVGKAGRIESALDPAPISMFENVINYKSEFATNHKGHRVRYKTDRNGNFILKNDEILSNAEILNQSININQLQEDSQGKYFRNWRPEIQSPDDIWQEIIRVTKIPGVTSAPKLQPIETRLVMLQTGMRAPMGIKVFGPSLEIIESFGLRLEQILKQVPEVKSEAVFAERVVGKPYLLLDIDRDAISRYGLNVEDIQKTIEVAIGGIELTSSVEGRNRFPVRVRYPRELRSGPEDLMNIRVSTPTGIQIPLGDLVNIEYKKGPQSIKSEDTFLLSYVLFDKMGDWSEVDVVQAAELAIKEKINSGELEVPDGISYKFSGSYENQIRAESRLALIVPLVLILVFLILYFQFKSVPTSLMVFAAIALAFSGGFVMIWLFGQNWFLDFSILGTNLHELFNMKTINLSVAVWVGFIALFGIATDDGVLIATYLDQSFASSEPSSISEIHGVVIEGGLKRIRPAIMTTATTIIALLPILTSTGRGADIMIPMAIPAMGGMFVAVLNYFMTPVLYSMRAEYKLRKHGKT